MTDLKQGRRLAQRKEQLEKDLDVAKTNEALDPDLVEDATVTSIKLEEALTTIDASDDYKAHLRAEMLRSAIMAHVNGGTPTATLEELEAMYAAGGLTP